MEAEAYVNAHASSFRNEKHIEQWRSTLSVQRDEDGNWIDSGHCLAIRDRAVAGLDTADVVALLQPIWGTIPETASRIRGRIERVLDAARVAGRRTGENPARWRGHLSALLPKRKKLTRGHHAALPYAAMPDLIAKLRGSRSIGALALEFTILSAPRTGEVIGATWAELDLADKVWTVPAERMKAGRPHRVPLTPRAVAILTELAKNRVSDFVFPGLKPSRPISNMTMTKALTAAGAGDFTVHGMRSSFRDFCAEETNFPREIAEAALAHVVGDATEQAYRRGDALEKRRKLMTAWANYIEPCPENNVVPIKRKQVA
jgi:integrase